MIDSIILSSSLSFTSSNSFEKFIVKIFSCRFISFIVTSGGIILLKPFGIMLFLVPPTTRPSNKSLAKSTPSHLHVGIVVLAT